MAARKDFARPRVFADPQVLDQFLYYASKGVSQSLLARHYRCSRTTIASLLKLHEKEIHSLCSLFGQRHIYRGEKDKPSLCAYYSHPRAGNKSLSTPHY